jgi:hypothetical protein
MRVPEWATGPDSNPLVIELHWLRQRGIWGLRAVAAPIPQLRQIARGRSANSPNQTDFTVVRHLFTMLPSLVHDERDRVAAAAALVYFGADREFLMKSSRARREQTAAVFYQQSFSQFRRPDLGAERVLLVDIARMLATLSGPDERHNVNMSTSGHGAIALDPKFQRLRAAWRDPSPIFDDVGVARFSGRRWLLEQLDAFLEDPQHDRGYLVVEAGSGLGKTALAAWLAWDRDLPCHFTLSSGGRRPITALRNLAVQLIVRFGLTDFLEEGALPAEAGEPGWFEQVLHAAARARTLANDRLVIVVDGLDEAEDVPGCLPLGLPVLLPAGAYIFVTCRSGTPLLGPSRDRRYFSIEARSTENTADVAEFLHRQAADEPFANLLAENDISPETFISTLTAQSGGVWVYLRYVLDDLRSGARSVGQIRGLPVGLAEYYGASILAMRNGPQWSLVYKPLLLALGVAREPLAMSALARLAGTNDTQAVADLCLRRWRPFLRALVTDREPTYALGHESLREFIIGAIDLSQPVWLRDLRGELEAAVHDAHSRICDVYLGDFGTLAQQLPSLAANFALADRDDGYPVRHLAFHLVRSRRESELHRLLAAEWLVGNGIRRSVWYDVHGRSGSIEGYLNDVDLARHAAAEETDAAIAGSLVAQSIGAEVRYALLRASVQKVTSRIPSALLDRLVATGWWTVAQAIARYEHITVPSERIEAAVALIPRISGARRSELLADAIATLDLLVNTTDRARLAGAILPLAEGYREALIEELLGRAVSTSRSYSIIECLQVVVSYAGPQLRPRLFDLAENLTGELCRSALDILAPAVDDATAEQAYTIVRRACPRPWPATMLVRLLPCVARPVRAALLAEAVRSLPWENPGRLAEAISDLSSILPRQRHQRLVDRALHAARTRSPLEYAKTVADLVAWLPAALREVYLKGALEALREHLSFGGRTTEDPLRILVLLLPHLPTASVDYACEIALLLPDALEVCYAAARLLEVLPEPNQVALATCVIDRIEAEEGELEPYMYDCFVTDCLVVLAPSLPFELLGRAVRVALKIASAQYIATGLDAIACRLDRPDRLDLMSKGLAVIGRAPDRFYRYSAVQTLSPHLEGRLLDVALGLVDDPDDGLSQIETMVPLLPHLDRPHLDTALHHLVSLAVALTDEVDVEVPGFTRWWGIHGFGSYLADEALNRVLDDTLSRAEEGSAARILGDLATVIPEWLLARSLAVISAEPSLIERAEALHAIAPRLSYGARTQAVRDFLAVIDRPPVTGEADHRGQVFLWLADHCSPRLAREAFEVIARIDDPAQQMFALQFVVPRLPVSMLTNALDLIRAVANDCFYRGKAIGQLAPRLPARLRDQIIGEAFGGISEMADSAGIPKSYRQLDALNAIAPLLPRGFHAAALEVIRQMPDEGCRRSALFRLLEVAADDLVEDIIQATREIADANERIRALATLAKAVTPPRRGLFEEVLLGMGTLIDGKHALYGRHQCEILAYVGADLPDDLIQLAIRLLEANTYHHEHEVVRALGSLAELPGEESRDHLLDLIARLPRDSTKKDSLIAVASCLSDRQLDRACRIMDGLHGDDQATVGSALAGPLWSAGSRLSSIAAIRASLNLGSRSVVLASIAANGSLIHRIGGSQAAADVAHALMRLPHWFP